MFHAGILYAEEVSPNVPVCDSVRSLMGRNHIASGSELRRPHIAPDLSRRSSRNHPGPAVRASAGQSSEFVHPVCTRRGNVLRHRRPSPMPIGTPDSRFQSTVGITFQEIAVKVPDKAAFTACR